MEVVGLDSAIKTKSEIEPLVSTMQKIEANGYKTRGEPIELTVNGVTGQWHSLKGGIRPTRQKPVAADASSNYEIFFNITANQWLKIVPPGPFIDAHTKMLRNSITIGQDALEVAGLPHLKDSLQECQITLRNQQVNGFLSPHLGYSLEYLLYELTGMRVNTKVPEGNIDYFTNIYQEAFQQAIILLTKYGHWMDDPNPGNILRHEDSQTGKTHTVLIDFSNKDQDRMSINQYRQSLTDSPDRITEMVNEYQKHQVDELYSRFRRSCRNLGLKLPYPHDILH